MRLKLDSILQSSLSRLQREQLWKGSCTTSHRNFDCTGSIVSINWCLIGVRLWCRCMFLGVRGEVGDAWGVTHFLLATLITSPLDPGLPLLFVVIRRVLVTHHAARTALENVHHASGASLPLGRTVGADMAPNADGAGRAHGGRTAGSDEGGPVHADTDWKKDALEGPRGRYRTEASVDQRRTDIERFVGAGLAIVLRRVVKSKRADCGGWRGKDQKIRAFFAKRNS